MINFYIAAFLADLALGAVLLSLPLLLIYNFGASSLTLGLFGALGAFVYCSGVITAGRLSDRLNRKGIIIAGCLLFAAVYSAVPFLRRIEHIFLIYIFGSISMSMFWPTIQSWISQGLNRKDLVRSLANFNISWSMGLMLGFLSAGALFSFGKEAPFLFGAFFILIVILFLLRQPVFSEMRDETAKRAFLLTEKERPPAAKRFLYIAWIANFMSWYILGTVRNMFAKLGTELGFSAFVIGALVFLFILAQSVMFFVLGRTAAWHYKIVPITALQIFAALGLIALAHSSRPAHIAAAMVLLGLSGGMTYFSSIFYSLYGFIDKGKRSGLHEAVIGTGSFFGPLVGGFAARGFGVRAPYHTAAVLLAAVIAVELFLYRKRRG